MNVCCVDFSSYVKWVKNKKKINAMERSTSMYEAVCLESVWDDCVWDELRLLRHMGKLKLLLSP